MVIRTGLKRHAYAAKSKDPYYKQGKKTQITCSGSKSQSSHEIQWLPTFND